MDVWGSLEKFIPEDLKFVVPHFALNGGYNFVALYLFSTEFYERAPLPVTIAISLLSAVLVTILIEALAIWSSAIVILLTKIGLNARVVAVCYGTFLYVQKFYKHFASKDEMYVFDSFIIYIKMLGRTCLIHAASWFVLYVLITIGIHLWNKK